jgi:methyl-accepting chemotaxis protein
MLLKIWTILFVASLFAGLVFYFYGNVNVGNSYRLFHVKAKNFLDFLLPVLVSGFVGSLVLGGLIALFFPHAFAGPLHRIERELVDIGAGNLDKVITLRKGSEVHELADAINDMAANLRVKMQNIKQVCEEINAGVEEFSAGDSESGLKRIADGNGRLQESLKRFKL